MNYQKDIEKVILFQIDKTSKVAKQYSQREFDKRGMGVTIDQWVLMKVIHENQNISQKNLAEKSIRDPASITRTLDILQKKGLASRESIPENRRQYQIRLTEEGNDFVERHMEFVESQRTKSTEGFSPEEIETLMKLLLKIQNNMS